MVIRDKEASLKMLEFELDDSHKKAQLSSKEVITLDSCMRAFSREELLSGADQWYCSKCKEQRDIHKKLELFRLPKILIVQLKRFQSKRSASKASGFISMAYAQIA
jgi:ubiquitin C-terminal hydrolase